MSVLSPATCPPPAAPGPPALRSSRRLVALGPPDTALTILLAEDDPVVRQLLRLVMEWHGDRVIEAEDGPTAVRLAESHQGPLDLLVTDVLMPGCNGPEVCDLVRTVRPGLPTLFISGYYPEAVFAETGLPARSAFLAKPFMPEDFVAAVDDLLASTSSLVQAISAGGQAGC